MEKPQEFALKNLMRCGKAFVAFNALLLFAYSQKFPFHKICR